MILAAPLRGLGLSGDGRAGRLQVRENLISPKPKPCLHVCTSTDRPLFVSVFRFGVEFCFSLKLRCSYPLNPMLMINALVKPHETPCTTQAAEVWELHMK